MSDLFSPTQLGRLSLRNRIVMAPMTRSRAGEQDEPTELMVEYYRARASAGMIITEGIFPSAEYAFGQVKRDGALPATRPAVSIPNVFANSATAASSCGSTPDFSANNSL